MNNLCIPIHLLQPDLQCPSYALPDSSGFDLAAAIQEDIYFLPSERVLIPTGIKMEIPSGYEGQIRSRSGLAFKQGIVVLNSPGTIDASYRGEIQVLLIHMGSMPFIISRGMRIAQMVIAPVCVVSFAPKEVLSSSLRQEGGFGSTG